MLFRRSRQTLGRFSELPQARVAFSSALARRYQRRYHNAHANGRTLQAIYFVLLRLEYQKRHTVNSEA